MEVLFHHHRFVITNYKKNTIKWFSKIMIYKQTLRTYGKISSTKCSMEEVLIVTQVNKSTEKILYVTKRVTCQGLLYNYRPH